MELRARLYNVSIICVHQSLFFPYSLIFISIPFFRSRQSFGLPKASRTAYVCIKDGLRQRLMCVHCTVYSPVLRMVYVYVFIYCIPIPQ